MDKMQLVGKNFPRSGSVQMDIPITKTPPLYEKWGLG
jgi:hypothetical protein